LGTDEHIIIIIDGGGTTHHPIRNRSGRIIKRRGGQVRVNPSCCY